MAVSGLCYNQTQAAVTSTHVVVAKICMNIAYNLLLRFDANIFNKWEGLLTELT